MTNLEIIAHRGASADAPENTLAAVQLAWEQGADAIEADFQLTRDGRIVAMHDYSTLRTAGADLQVSEHTYAELQSLDVGSWKADRWRGERIPTIEQLLATMPTGRRLYVEIKCGGWIAEPLAAAVRTADVPPSQIVLICFNAGTLRMVRRLLPESPTYLVIEFLRDPHTHQWFPDADEMVGVAQESELTGVDVMAARLDAELAARVQAAGLDLCAWTVDLPDEARRLISLGVRRITTNEPAKLRASL